MKYVIKAVLEVKWFVIAILGVMFMYQYNSAKLLEFIHLAVETADQSYVNYVIMALIADVVLETVLWRQETIDKYVFTTLNNMLCDKILDVDVTAFEQFSLAKIATMQSNNIKLANLVKTIIHFSSSIITVFIYAYSICMISTVALFPMLLTGLVLGILLYVLNNKWEEIDEKFNAKINDRNTELTEIIYGFSEVRTFGSREIHRKSLNNLNNQILRFNKKRAGISQIMTALAGTSSSVMSILGLLYVIMLVNNGTLTSSIAVTLILYLWRMTKPFCDMIFAFSDIAEYRAAIPLFAEFMDYKNSINNGNVVLESFDDKIELNNMNFYYDSSNTVLQDINMEIVKGQHIGICGESGGGKSTLLKLLLRFYDATGGSISIDGIDIKKLNVDSYRSKIGIVSQDVHIFEGSIRDNIAYALKGRAPIVPEEEIIRVAKQAKLWDFVSKLKDGLDTNVGPNGLKLSGGQKQRISIARLLLADPDIILLDEATSALDNETEKYIKDTINMLAEKTVIAVAHRLTTIKDFDKIYVLNNKKIVGCGTHKDLLKNCAEYQKMWVE